MLYENQYIITFGSQFILGVIGGVTKMKKEIDDKRVCAECDVLKDHAVEKEKLVIETQMEQETDELPLEKIVTDQERDALMEQLEQYRANEMRLKAQIEDLTASKDAQIAALKENEG